MAHQQVGNQICRGAATQQRQQAERLPGGLESENHGGEQGARSARENCGHSHQRRDARIEAERGKKRGRGAAQHRAEAAADGEQRGQGSPRGAAAQGDHP